MEKNFGVQGCGGGCGGNETFGSVMQNKMIGVGDAEREAYAFTCASEYEQQIIAAGGEAFDDATWNSYMDLCRGQYDAGARSSETGNTSNDNTGNDDYWTEYCKTAPLQDICNPASPCWIDEATCKAKGGNLVSQFKEYETGDSCSAEHTIKTVQLATGNPNVDGKWGPESQKYLNASGMAYKDIVPGCTGAVPGTGGGGTTVPGDNTDVQIDVTTGTKQGWLDIPWWAWALIGVGALGLGAGGVYLATRDKEEKEPGMSGAEPMPKFVNKMERKYRGKKIANRMKRDSKGRFVGKKMSYRKR